MAICCQYYFNRLGSASLQGSLLVLTCMVRYLQCPQFSLDVPRFNSTPTLEVL